jgi:hypothetical protein
MSDSAELEQMKAELDDLRAQVSTETRARRRRLRTITAWVLTVLAVLATTLALLNVWAFRTLTNTDLFVQRIGVVIEDPEVAAAVGSLAANELVDAIGLQQRLEQQLPPELSVAAGPITSAATNLLSQGATRLAETPQFQEAFEVALATGHRLTIDVLSGAETDAVSTQGGEVVLDLTPVINELITQGSDFLSGVLGRDIPAPQVSPDNVDDAVAAVESRLGVDVPADFGQVTLFQSDDLATAQQGYQLARWSAILAPLAALLLIALAVAVSTRRLRTFLSVVVGTALALLLVSLAFQPLKASVIGSVSEQGLSGAVSDSLELVLSSLRTGIVVVVVLGVLAAFLLFLTGESRAAGRSRELVGETPSLAGRHRTAFLIGGAVVGLVLLAVIPGRSLAQIGVGLLLYAAYALAVVFAPRPVEDEQALADAEAQQDEPVGAAP